MRDLLRCVPAATYASLAASPELDATVWVVDNASGDGSAEMVGGRVPAGEPHRAAATTWVSRAATIWSCASSASAVSANARRRPTLPNFPTSSCCSTRTPNRSATRSGRWRASCVDASRTSGGGRRPTSVSRWPLPARRLRLPRPVAALVRSLSAPAAPPARLAAQRPLSAVACTTRADRFPIDFALGAALMVRREAIEAAGLLDEGYFMYAEEVDWCWRMRRCGLAVLLRAGRACDPSRRREHPAVSQPVDPEPVAQPAQALRPVLRAGQAALAAARSCAWACAAEVRRASGTARSRGEIDAAPRNGPHRDGGRSATDLRSRRRNEHETGSAGCGWQP